MPVLFAFRACGAVCSSLPSKWKPVHVGRVWGYIGAKVETQTRQQNHRSALHFAACGARGLSFSSKWRLTKQISIGICDFMVHMGRLWGYIGAKVETQTKPQQGSVISCCTWGACGAISGQRLTPKRGRKITDTSDVLQFDICGARSLS